MLWCGVPAVVCAEDRVSDDEILSRIVSRARAFEEEFVGSYSRRELSVQVFEGGGGDLKATREVVVDVWDYHGESPVNVVRACTIDEKPVALADCVEEQRLEPAHRLFGADSENHYRFEYRGLTTWEGQPCHKIGVVPLKATTRHLEGDLFYLEGSLRIAGMDFTLADYPFGLKDLAIQLFFADRDGKAVIERGVSSVHIYVPFLIHEQTRTEFVASRQRLLEERDPASVAAASTAPASR